MIKCSEHKAMFVCYSDVIPTTMPAFQISSRNASAHEVKTLFRNGKVLLRRVYTAYTDI